MANTNTKSATQEMTRKINEAQKNKITLKEYYEKEEKIDVTGSPFYRPYFGDVMPININGFLVCVPLDGKHYKIPKTFADVFNERIKRIDATQTRYGIMGANIEDMVTAGDVELQW